MPKSLAIASLAEGYQWIDFKSTVDGSHWSQSSRLEQTSGKGCSIVEFQGKVWIAFIANDSGNNVLVCSSPDGVNWSGGNTDIHQAAGSSPSLAVFNNRLWIAFTANDSGNNVLVCYSDDGVTWSNDTDIHQASGAAPSLTVFDGKLWAAFIANESGKNVLVCSSPDGVNWSNNTDIQQSSGAAPSLAVFAGKLWVAFTAHDSGNNVLVCSSLDGVHWSDNTDIKQAASSAPSLAVFDNKLWVAFIANNSPDNVQGADVLVCSSPDGKDWSSNKDVGIPGTDVSLSVFDNFTFVPYPPPTPPPPPSGRSLVYRDGRVYGLGAWSTIPCSIVITSGAGNLPAGPWIGDINYPGIPIESPCSGNPGEYFVVQASNAAGESATLQIDC